MTKTCQGGSVPLGFTHLRATSCQRTQIDTTRVQALRYVPAIKPAQRIIKLRLRAAGPERIAYGSFDTFSVVDTAHFTGRPDHPGSSRNPD